MNDQQMSRYRQLDLQNRGFNAFMDSDVQKRLNLTPEQMRGIRDATEWSQQQMQDINRAGARDRDEGSRMYQTYQREFQQRLNKILNQDQQKTWRGMTGEPYQFRPSFGTTGRTGSGR